MTKRQQKEPQRYYVVSNKDGHGHCLVEANSPTQAQSYAAQHFTDVRLATVKEAVRMQTDGTVVVRWQGRPMQTDIEDVTGPPTAAKAVENAVVKAMNSDADAYLHTGTRLPPISGSVTSPTAPAPAGPVAPPTTVAGTDAPPTESAKPGNPGKRTPRGSMAADVFGKGFAREDE